MKLRGTLFRTSSEHFLNRPMPLAWGSIEGFPVRISLLRWAHLDRARDRVRGRDGFTLTEVVMSLAISTLLFSGVVLAYIQSAYRAEWTGYSLAAQALAIQQVEQARAAVWDPTQTPPKNEFTNLVTRSAALLDMPISGTNAVWATNYSTVQSVIVENSVGASVYKVRVDTVWPFQRGAQVRYFTNTVVDYFAPE
jgi:prepilin-type N-terminal cleavage/methylation domain-containing protein